MNGQKFVTFVSESPDDNCNIEQDKVPSCLAIKTVTRRAKPPRTFYPHLEKCVGHS